MRRGCQPHNADQIDGITVEQIKRLMLCFAKRSAKSYFSRYASMVVTKSMRDGATATATTTASGLGLGQFSPKDLSPEFTRRSQSNALLAGVGDAANSSEDDEDDKKRRRRGGGDGADGDDGDEEDEDTARNERLLNESASCYNVQLRPLNRAVFIERVRAVLPDRPESVINSWFSQLDTDRVGLVTWSAFSAFLLFRSATAEAADAKLAEFHAYTDAPEAMPPGVVRHHEPATCMLINPKSGELLTAGADGVIYAWDPLTLEPHGAVLTLRSYVTGMELMDAGGTRIAIACMDRSVTIVESRTMRVLRCFAGRSMPKHFEAAEQAKIVEFFEKRPDWIRIERGPRVLTAPPEVASYTAIMENVKRAAPAAASGSSSGGGGGTSPQRGNNNSPKRGSSPARLGGGAVQGHAARHVDRPWVQGGGGGAGDGRRGAGGARGATDIDESSAVGTYLVGEASLARSDVARRAEIHALLDMDNCPSCMCIFPVSATADDARGRVASGISSINDTHSHHSSSGVVDSTPGIDGAAGIDGGGGGAVHFQPDPLLFGMPDGTIKQYNLPTMFPRATVPRAAWRPHTDRVRMMRYVPEIHGVLSSSDDGTFVLSHPDRVGGGGGGNKNGGGHYTRTSTSGATDILRQFKVPNSHMLSAAAAASGAGAASSALSFGSSIIVNNAAHAGGGGLASLSGATVTSARLTMAEQLRLKMGFAPVHVPAVVCFDYCAELKMVACCAYDRYAFLFDATQDRHSARLAGLSAPAVAVAFNGVDNQVVVAAADRTVRIYDTRHSDMPLQTLERPAFQQFGHIGNRGLLVHDRRIYIGSNFPVSYCSRAAYAESQAKLAQPSGNKVGAVALPGRSKARGGGANSNNGGGVGRGSIIPGTGGMQRRTVPLARRRNDKGVQPFHTAPLLAAFVDDVGISGGVLRLFTLCPQQMMCWTLLAGDGVFALALPSTSTGRSVNQATCACASEGCLKVVVGYDDGSVVLWVPSVGEAAARLPDHETIHARVRCTAFCYRRSFSQKQMLILASIESSVLFLAQGEPYTLQVASSWTSSAELGPVTCMHELGTANSVLCGTQSGALVVLSLTNYEMEGSPMWPSTKVLVGNAAAASSDASQSSSSDATASSQSHLEDNEFGKVESIVHYPAFGPNVYAAVHTNGDVVFWDPVHRVQLGALCIRGMQTSIVHTVVRDLGGGLQVILYTDELGNVFLRKLNLAVVGMEHANGAQAQGQHGGGFGNASFGSSPMSRSLNPTATAGGSSGGRLYLDPAVALNINSSAQNNAAPALVVAGSRGAGISAACTVVGVYRAPWDEYRSSKHQQSSSEDPFFASSTVGRERTVSFHTGGAASSGTTSTRARRKSTTFDELGEQLDESEVRAQPPEYICVVTSNTTVSDARCYCFEVTDGYVCHVGSGGGAQWLSAPRKDEMMYCVDAEDWKLQMDASVCIEGLNPEGAVTGAARSGFFDNDNSAGDYSPLESGLDSLGATPAHRPQERRLSDESLASPMAGNLGAPAIAVAAAPTASGKVNGLLGSRRSATLPSKLVPVAAAASDDSGDAAKTKTATTSSADVLAATAAVAKDEKTQLEPGSTTATAGQQFLSMFSRGDEPDSRCATPFSEPLAEQQPQCRVSFPDEDEDDVLIRKKKELLLRQQQQQQQAASPSPNAGPAAAAKPTAGPSSRKPDANASGGSLAETGGGGGNAVVGIPKRDDGGGGGGGEDADEEEEEDEATLMLRGDYLQQQLFHKPRPPRIGKQPPAAALARRPANADRGASASSAATASSPSNERPRTTTATRRHHHHHQRAQVEHDGGGDDVADRPLALIVPHGHNDRSKVVQRVTAIVRADALEEMRERRIAARRAQTAAAASSTTGSETGPSTSLFLMTPRHASSGLNVTALGSSNANNGANNNHKWGVLRAASSIMTPRSLSLSARPTYLSMSPAAGALSMPPQSMTVNGMLAGQHHGAGKAAGSISMLKRMGTPNATPLDRPLSLMSPSAAAAASGLTVGDGDGARQHHSLARRTPLPALALPGEDAGNDAGNRPATQESKSPQQPDDALSLVVPAHDQHAHAVSLELPAVTVSGASPGDAAAAVGAGGGARTPRRQSNRTPIPGAAPTPLPSPAAAAAAGFFVGSALSAAPYGAATPRALSIASESPNSPLASGLVLNNNNSNNGEQQQQQPAAAQKRYGLSVSLEQLAHKHLLEMRHRFRSFSSEVQREAELIAQRAEEEAQANGGGGGGGLAAAVADAVAAAAAAATPVSGGVGEAGASAAVAPPPVVVATGGSMAGLSRDAIEFLARTAGVASSGGAASAAASGGGGGSLLIIDSTDRKSALAPEPLGGYTEDGYSADVLLGVLREKKPLEMHRAMGIGGKTSIFGVLQPTAELLERWKQRQAEEERARSMASAEGVDLIIPRREEAGLAFVGTGPQLTQMRGRRKIESAADDGASPSPPGSPPSAGSSSPAGGAAAE